MISLDTGLWRGQPAASTFNPLSLSPALWLDASDASTLFQSNGGSAATANGDPVGYWLDKSGKGNHAEQTDGTKKPLLQTASLNGKAGILGDGINDEIISALNLNGKAGMTLFMVAKPVSGNGMQAGCYNGAAGVFGRVAQTASRFDGKPLGSGSYSSAVESYSSSFAPKVFFGGWDGLNLKEQTNNGSVTTTSVASGALVCQNTFSLFQIAGSIYGNGIIYDLICLDYYATTTQITKVFSYLNSKWAVY